jgi:hypothetical protein
MNYYCAECGSEIKIDDKKTFGYDSGNCPICGADAYGSDGLGEYRLLPAHETVAQWEQRKGREYPDTAPVYARERMGYHWVLSNKYRLKDCLEWDGRPHYGDIVVATEAGAPPNDWRPEEEPK